MCATCDEPAVKCTHRNSTAECLGWLVCPTGPYICSGASCLGVYGSRGLPTCQAMLFGSPRCAKVSKAPLRFRTHRVRTRPLMLRPLTRCSPVGARATREVKSSTIQCDPAAAASVVDRREARWLHQTRAVSVQAEHRRGRGGHGDHRGAIGALEYDRSCILNSEVRSGADP